MSISIVYLTYLVQDVLYGINSSGGNRAAAAGAIILVIMQFLLAFLLTSPEDSWFRSFGTKTVNYGGNLSHRFVNSVRPNARGSTKEKDLPRRYDDETDIGDGATRREEFELATALHGYQASADDPSELSFEKGDTLEVLDKRGNWWQARKPDGSTGIVPSNYFQ
ncbi:hypothetical protein BY458DRAFT_467881 [Sporodiniella umbellata]|nr:hypothetical protein BY458DRAFT_467881 [Sporodiniella umbellata]